MSLPASTIDRAAASDFASDLTERGIVPDILLNNAGLARGLSPIHEGEIDDWEEMIDTNVKGLLYLTRAILPLMVERDRGHVINIGSTAGRWVYPGATYTTLYEGFTPLTAEDIADAVCYVANARSHVNVLQVVIECMAQRSAAVLHREGA